MRLLNQSTIMLGIVTSILTFYYAPNTSTTQEKLQAITDQIDTELSLIGRKGNQPRVLSKRLIKEISIFSNSCPLEKITMNGVQTKEAYSIERGKLLLALLQRKLAPITYKKIFESVTFQNAFLKNANLKAVNLSRIQLSRAYLVGAELNNTNLEGVNLYKSNLSKANLSAANLKAANLRETIFNGANLSDANFTNAYLVAAKLGNKARLDRADFTGANLSNVDFTNVHPSFVKP